MQFKLSCDNWLFKEGFLFQARAKSEINLQGFHEDLNFSQGQKSSIEDVRQFHFNQNRAHVKSFTRQVGEICLCWTTEVKNPWLHEYLLRQSIGDRGSVCGSVGRVGASYTRDPRFETSHQQNFIHQLYNR